MEKDLELQVHPSNNHQYVQDHPSSSSSRSPLDIHSSVSSSSSLVSSHSNSMTNTTPISTLHYSYLFSNNFSGFQDETDDSDLFTLSTESDRSTLLHLAASVGQSDFIRWMGNSQSEARNAKGDLPIHVAARACQLEAVNILVSFAEELGRISMILESQNNYDNNTALHIALENHQEEMAKLLFQKCKKTFYYLNSKGFSPLYLAIKAQFWDLVTLMLSADAADDQADNHLLRGKSVVHAAIVAKRKDVLEKMTDTYGDLLWKARDELGRTPLSYAAYIGFLEGVKCIIDHFGNAAYKIDSNGYFPIHWACRGGDIKVVNEFFNSYSEHTRRLLNNEGQSILHVAAEYGKAEVVKYILKCQELETMINMKDKDGNTPLHLGSKAKHPRVVYLFTLDKRLNLTAQNKNGMTALDLADNYGDIPSFEERLTWLSLTYAGVPRAPQLHYFNIRNVDEGGIDGNNNPPTLEQNNTTSQTPTAFIALDQQGNVVQQHPRMKRKTKYKERINSLLVVSILVATVTFASGFTVPGGYKNENPDEGMATLAHKCAFQVFVITNTIALYSSILASVTLIWALLDDLRLIVLSLDLALPLLGTSLVMMTVAFTAGLYVVLHDVIFWLGIVMLVMGGVFLGLLLLLFVPLHPLTSCIRNSFLRYFFHVPFTLMLLACEKGKTEIYY